MCICGRLDKDQEGRWSLSYGERNREGNRTNVTGRWEGSAGTGMVSAGRGWRLERPDGTGG